MLFWRNNDNLAMLFWRKNDNISLYVNGFFSYAFCFDIKYNAVES